MRCVPSARRRTRAPALIHLMTSGGNGVKNSLISPSRQTVSPRSGGKPRRGAPFWTRPTFPVPFEQVLRLEGPPSGWVKDFHLQAVDMLGTHEKGLRCRGARVD
jgi:hypothetical protein